MKEKINIVFMGTPEFAVTTLKTLIENNYNVSGVVTAPDKPSGRGRKLTPSPVKQYALTQGLPVLQPNKLRDSYFIDALKSLEANLYIVVAFRMLPKVIWKIPTYGTFNLHASLLPQYRGAAPINWAIINQETKTGVTTFFIDDKIDTGAMLLQKEVAITQNETAGSLHDKLMMVGADLVVETVKHIAQNNITPKKQPELKHLKPAPKIYKETCKINWKSSLSEIDAFIRGLSPYPTAWAELFNNSIATTIKIYKITYTKMAHTITPGKLYAENQQLLLAHKDGIIEILEVQLPGKRKMYTKDLLNGFDIKSDAYIC